MWEYMGRKSAITSKYFEESYPPWRIPSTMENSGNYSGPPAPKDVTDGCTRFCDQLTESCSTDAISQQTRSDLVIE